MKTSFLLLLLLPLCFAVLGKRKEVDHGETRFAHQRGLKMFSNAHEQDGHTQMRHIRAVTAAKKTAPPHNIQFDQFSRAALHTGSLKLDANGVPYLLIGSKWMPICGHYFWNNNIGADIVCQNLGYSQGGVLQHVRGVYNEDAYYVGRCDSKSITDLENGCTKEVLAAQYSCKKGRPVSIRVKCRGSTDSELKFQLKGRAGQETVTISIAGHHEKVGLTGEWKTFSYPRPASGSFSIEFHNDAGNRDVYIQGHESQVADLLPDFRANKGWGCGTTVEHERCAWLRSGFFAWNGKYTYTLKDSAIDGGWTEFSDWSSCSKTCGVGNKERSRTCANPPPSFGGEDCQGQSREVQTCVEVENCHSSPKFAAGEISYCFSACNDGILNAAPNGENDGDVFLRHYTCNEQEGGLFAKKTGGWTGSIILPQSIGNGALPVGPKTFAILVKHWQDYVHGQGVPFEIHQRGSFGINSHPWPALRAWVDRCTTQDFPDVFSKTEFVLVVITVDYKDITVYRNGVKLGSKHCNRWFDQGFPTENYNPLELGDNHMAGTIKSFAVWNRVLSQEEVESIDSTKLTC